MLFRNSSVNNTASVMVQYFQVVTNELALTDTIISYCEETDNFVIDFIKANTVYIHIDGKKDLLFTNILLLS